MENVSFQIESELKKDARINAIDKKASIRPVSQSTLAFLARDEIFMSCMSNTDARTFIIRRNDHACVPAAHTFQVMQSKNSTFYSSY